MSKTVATASFIAGMALASCIALYFMPLCTSPPNTTFVGMNDDDDSRGSAGKVSVAVKQREEQFQQRPPTPKFAPTSSPVLATQLKSKSESKLKPSTTAAPRTEPPRPDEREQNFPKKSEAPTTTSLPATTSLLGDNNGLPLPWMQPEEVAAILALLNKSTRYIEWGSGGSTWTYAIRTGRADSIEHSVGWCNNVKGKLANLKITHVTLHCVGVEPGYLGWGGGFEEGTYAQFEAYVEAVHKLNIANHSVDVILDDGRARVPVALTTLQYLKPTGTLIIHDFTWRPYYHVVLKYYDLVTTVKSLVLLRPKATVSSLSREEIIAASPTKFKRKK